MQMKRILSGLLLVAALLSAAPASAHMFWVNLIEATNHPPGHMMTSLGFGHHLPLDDFLVGKDGTIRIADYELIGPHGKRFSLGKPDATPGTGELLGGLEIVRGDLALRKLELTQETAPGTYQVAATSEPAFFTIYIDDKGKQRMAGKSIDAIKDLKKVLESFRYQTNAKSYFAVKKWTDPAPLGGDLEITPLDDLSDVHVGDLVRFRVTYLGKPVNATSKAIRTMSCTSNTFGGPDKFFLSAYLSDGIAQFRLPTAGQWVADTILHEDVAAAPALADLKGKCTRVFTAASISFTVKP